MENPGFFFDFQLIDVQDFNGVGESEPNPYFYQVSTLNFTRLHGEDLISPPLGITEWFYCLFPVASVFLQVFSLMFNS